MNFEDIHSIEDLAVVSEEGVWQNFERLAAFIFEKNGFRVKVNTVKTHQKTKRQYDVIAWKGSQTFLVECKKWAGNRYRLSAVKKAVEQHKERTTFYAAITNEDAIPLLVTLIEEDIRVYEGVPIVPVQKSTGSSMNWTGMCRGISFASVKMTCPMRMMCRYWHLIFRNRMKENPKEGDAGNFMPKRTSCSGVRSTEGMMAPEKDLLDAVGGDSVGL